MRRPLLATLPCLPALLALAGCGHSPPTHFLTLDAAPPAAPPGAITTPPLRVTQVRLPATLDRIEFVTVPGPGRIALHEQEHWAAQPGELAREALLGDLALRLPAGAVLPLDAGPGARSWRVALDVLALSADADGARLDGVLSLAPDAGGAAVRLDLHLADPTPIPVDDAALRPVATARAYSRLLGQAADRVVAAMARPALP